MSKLTAEVSSLASERDALEREADQMQRDMHEMAAQLQVRGGALWRMLVGGCMAVQLQWCCSLHPSLFWVHTPAPPPPCLQVKEEEVRKQLAKGTPRGEGEAACCSGCVAARTCACGSPAWHCLCIARCGL